MTGETAGLKDDTDMLSNCLKGTPSPNSRGASLGHAIMTRIDVEESININGKEEHEEMVTLATIMDLVHHTGKFMSQVRNLIHERRRRDGTSLTTTTPF